MFPNSFRVCRVLDLLRELTDEEWMELAKEPLAESLQVGQAWVEEVDRRAQQALRGEGKGLSRPALTALLRGPPEEARAYLAHVLASRT